MRFSYSDVIKALDDANKMLLSVESEDELLVSPNYDYLSIYCKNRITGIKTLIIDNAYRDEGYRYLEGFITALLIARPTILEENNNTNDDTKRSEEKTSVPAKIHLSWIDKLKRWI